MVSLHRAATLPATRFPAVPEVALILWGVFGVLGIGLRVLIQLRTTGSTGVVLVGGTAGALEWISGGLFVGSLVIGVLAPLQQLNDAIEPFGALDGLGAQLTGLVLFAVGLLGMIGAQSAMGRSWRLGVPQERTELVTGGPFALVRNPIYTAMIVAVAGLALLAPNALSLTSAIALIAGLELHVRFAEEPHLLRSHGEEYTAYASRVGRFVPGVGRLRPDP
jgi:protein-S-isoprenylcysteine O-methyltransferase Ste14